MASRRSIIWDDQHYRPVKMTERMSNCGTSWNDLERGHLETHSGHDSSQTLR